MAGLTYNPPDVQVFDANGTWVRPDLKLYKRAFIWVCSAGGGGAGDALGGSIGGGGGGGAVWYGWIDLAQLSATETVTVGAGGAGGAAGNFDGAAGGTSRFGTVEQAPPAGAGGLCDLNGGTGGNGGLGGSELLGGGNGGTAGGQGFSSTGGGAGGSSLTAAATNPLHSTTDTSAPTGSCLAAGGGRVTGFNQPASKAPSPGGGGATPAATIGGDLAGGDGGDGRVVVICF